MEFVQCRNVSDSDADVGESLGWTIARSLISD